MEVIHGSTLNPNAPMFVPLAYRTVEDFSDEWWALVQSSPWFRDYWLRERYHDPQNEIDTSFSDFEFDEDVLFHHHHSQEDADEGKEVMRLGALKWERGGGRVEAPRYPEKAPKIVKCRVTPRAIHQPR